MNSETKTTKLQPGGGHASNEPLSQRNGVVFLGIETATEYDDADYLLCPVCGHHCSHIASAYRNDNRHLWASYGNASVEIRGECGHNWLIVFCDHKGSVYVDTVVLPDDPKGDTD